MLSQRQSCKQKRNIVVIDQSRTVKRKTALNNAVVNALVSSSDEDDIINEEPSSYEKSIFRSSTNGIQSHNSDTDSDNNNVHSVPSSSFHNNKNKSSKQSKINRIRNECGHEQKQSKADQKWDYMYSLLLDYEREHGHCRISLSYQVADRDGKALNLGQWLGTQRQLKRKDQLNGSKLHRLQALADAGKLEWGAADKVSDNDDRWERSFTQILVYGSTYGHCNVPQKYEVHVPTIRSGVTGMNTTTTEEVVPMHILNSLLDSDSEDCAHNTQHLQDSKSSVNSSVGKTCKTECILLGKWLEKQRRMMRSFELRADRANKLQDLVDKGLLVINSQDEEDRRWQQHYDALVRYGEIHRHCNVPHKYEVEVPSIYPTMHTSVRNNCDIVSSSNNNKPVVSPDHKRALSQHMTCSTVILKLGVWLTTQRHLCHKKDGVIKIRPERLAKLQLLADGGLLKWGDLYFDKERKWEQTFQALVCYELEPGTMYNDIPRSVSVQIDDGWHCTQVNLHSWLMQQLAKHKDGKLLPHRVDKLQCLVDNGRLSWDLLPPSQQQQERQGSSIRSNSGSPAMYAQQRGLADNDYLCSLSLGAQTQAVYSQSSGSYVTYNLSQCSSVDSLVLSSSQDNNQQQLQYQQQQYQQQHQQYSNSSYGEDWGWSPSYNPSSGSYMVDSRPSHQQFNDSSDFSNWVSTKGDGGQHAETVCCDYSLGLEQFDIERSTSPYISC